MNPIFEGQWRLSRIELVNWGTFHGHHSVDVERRGFLITGGSGSGKSTMLDAISSVLTPRSKTKFNAAATTDSGKGGRNHLTYVRGAWRKTADENTGEIGSAFLRTGATWSGVALQYSDGRGRTQSLIKLFHVKPSGSVAADVKELGIVSPTALGLLELQPYAQKGLNSKGLRTAFPEAHVETDHASFERRFTRALGLVGDRATTLLHKTQSAKNMRSLDELFRGFMLEEPETFRIAQHAVEQFGELDAAHKSVVKAKQQVASLTPLREANSVHADAVAKAEHINTLLGALDDFVVERRTVLTREALTEYSAKLGHAQHELDTATSKQEQFQRQAEEFRDMVNRSGGGRVQLLESQIMAAQQLQQQAEEQLKSLKKKLQGIQWLVPSDAEEFSQLVALCEREIELNQQNVASLNEEAQNAVAGMMSLQGRQAEVAEQLKAMRNSKSNINHKLVAARQMIAHKSGLNVTELPFAGELLQVREAQAQWTGALERVLKPLTLTMLVPAAHEKAVVRAVNELNLGTRLTYESVAQNVRQPQADLAENSLVYMIDVAQGPFASWLHERLASRFDYACVIDSEALARTTRGVTLQGQVKRGPRSYEKDDRSQVGNRREWVMGFDNQAMIDELLQEHQQLSTQLDAARATVADVNDRKELNTLRYHAATELVDRKWSAFDVASQSAKVADLKKSLATFLADDHSLRDAQQKLEAALASLKKAETARSQALSKVARAEESVERATRSLQELSKQQYEPVNDEISAALDAEFSNVKKVRQVTHETISEAHNLVERALNKRKEAAVAELHHHETLMAETISAFRHEWPEACLELTSRVEDRMGYLGILERLELDRLPDFEARFYGLMRDQTQQNFATIREAIQQGVAEIRYRIDMVNESLSRSEYAEGTTLQIRIKDSRPAVATEFLKDLQKVTSGAFAADMDKDAADARFAIIAEMMKMLSSSESTAKTWRQQCLDVRTHVHFTAVEIDAHAEEVNYYESTESLSGGQGQKLVAFCLASALRYQLTSDDLVPNFGSVIMDEAFDKTDDRNTRAALDVYNKFGFHMILANPLKSLGSLEDYIGGLVLVTCQDGKQSSLATMTYEEARMVAA